MKKEFWLKKRSIKRRVKDDLVDFIYEIISDSQPLWCSPWVSYNRKRKSLYISLTEEESYSAYLKWSEFVEIILQSENETLVDLLPKLEKLTVKIKNILNKV